MLPMKFSQIMKRNSFSILKSFDILVWFLECNMLSNYILGHNTKISFPNCLFWKTLDLFKLQELSQNDIFKNYPLSLICTPRV